MGESGILRLNEADVEQNSAYGAHDPGMMWDPRTRRYYSYSTDSYAPKAGLGKAPGIPVRVSADLVNFTYAGTVLSPAAVKEGRDNGDYPPTRASGPPTGSS